MAFALGDGEALNAANPRTFFIPPAEVRENLAPGDLVKLLFLPTDDGEPDPDAGGERMWVLVTEQTAGGYIGDLDNDPVVVSGIAAGDPVAFAPRHVIATWDDTPHVLAGTTTFVTERLFDEDDPPIAWLEYDPDDAGLESTHGRTRSGWMLYSGDEPDELTDVDVRVCDTLWLLERWPEMAPVLEKHDGAPAWFRRAGDGWEREPDDD